MKIFLIVSLVLIVFLTIVGTVLISLPTKVLEDLHEKAFGKEDKEEAKDSE